jgi:cell division control protein 24
VLSSFTHCCLLQEGDFVVYEPYCGNYLKATETTMELVQLLEVSHLLPLSLSPADPTFLQRHNNILNARSELPAFLIKPVQRVCKYPLLMEVSW